MTLETLQSILKDKKFWIFLVILVVVAIAGASLLVRQLSGEPTITGYEKLYNISPPKNGVVRVEPLPDKKGISTNPTIIVMFEKSIIGKKVQITSSPEASFNQAVSSNGFTLTLTPKESLKPSTKYTFSVIYEKSKIYVWSFTTGKKGGDPQLIDTIKNKLPYKSTHLTISYSSTTDKFFVFIDAKPIDTYKKAALDWFASQGLVDAEKKINIFYYLVGEAAD